MNSNAYSFFIGWFVILLLFYGSTKFEGTRTITYYVLWLSIVLLLVTHAPDLQALLQAAVPQVATDQQGQQQ